MIEIGKVVEQEGIVMDFKLIQSGDHLVIVMD